MRDEPGDHSRLLPLPASLGIATVASLSCRVDGLLASDVISAIDFNESGEFFATGGIARKIRVCSYQALTNRSQAQADGAGHQEEDEDDDGEDCHRSSKRSRGYNIKSLDHEASSVAMLCTPAKLSSVKWVPRAGELLGCGDYDGVVWEWNVETGVSVTERHEHGGMSVWSLDYSTNSCFDSASAGGDGTVRLWSRGSDMSVGAIRSPRGRTMCSAEFSVASPELLAVACADGNIYLYDLRNLQAALLVVGQHDRAASYVRFMGKDSLVSASIDSTIKLWDISTISWGSTHLGNAGEQPNARLVRTFDSHSNSRNFVGLSVLADVGLLACGSETNDVFVYESSAVQPLWRCQFANNPRYDPGVSDPSTDSFVAAVCWKQQHDHYSLVAANSDGIVQVIQARLALLPRPALALPARPFSPPPTPRRFTMLG